MDGAPAAGIHALPRELLSAMLSYLDVRQRAVAGSVCKAWRAAALEPPYSSELSLAVFGDVPDGCARGAAAALLSHLLSLLSVETGPPPCPALTARMVAVLATAPRALSVGAAAGVLGGPMCAGLLRLRLAVLLRPEAEAEHGQADADLAAFCLEAALRAAAPSLQHLDLHFPAADTSTYPGLWSSGPLDQIFARLAPVFAERAARLRSLALRGSDGPVHLPSLDEARVPAMPELEYLGALVQSPKAGALATRLPRLRRLWGVSLYADPEGTAALAALGLRCRHLRVAGADLGRGGALAAAAALFRPGDFPPDSGTPAVVFGGCELAPGLDWDDAYFEGALSVEVIDCYASENFLLWLGERAASASFLRIECDLQLAEDASAEDLVDVLRALPRGTGASASLTLALLEGVLSEVELIRACKVEIRAGSRESWEAYEVYRASHRILRERESSNAADFLRAAFEAVLAGLQR
eukprot:tig00021348_g20555.t1